MEVKPGYKQTEVGMIPEDWKTIDLSRLCTLQRGFDITEATRIPGPVPVYSSSGISYFHSKAMVLPPGVVTGRKGLLGKVFLIDEPFWPHDTTLWVKDFRGNHPAYVALVLQSFHLERLDAATSVPTLNRNNLAGHFVAFPPTLAEQEAIAEALSDADALIESLEQLLAKKRLLKQGAMQELLTGKKRLPGFEINGGYKQTEVGVIPGDWEVARLATVCSMKSGEGITSTSIGQFSKYPCYGGNGLRGFTTRFTHDGRYALIGRQGALCGNVLAVEGKVFASEHAIVVTASARTDISWLTFILGEMRLNQYSESSAQPGLSVSKLLSLDVAHPPTKAEQTAIATILSDMDAEIAALETKLSKARQLKQGMMQELLTGRIRLV